MNSLPPPPPDEIPIPEEAYKGLAPDIVSHLWNMNFTPIDQGGRGGWAYGDGRTEMELTPRLHEIAQHELLHHVAFQHPSYRGEDSAGYPRLLDALNRDAPSLAPWDQQMSGLKADPQHAFTGIALYKLAGGNLPPALSEYFAPLTQDRWTDTGPQ